MTQGRVRKVVRSAGKFLGLILVVALLGAALAYPIADWMRVPMDERARAELLRDGKAEKFVKTSLGTVHVRDSGPVDGPVVLLAHGGVIGGYAFDDWRKPIAAAGFRVIVPDFLGYGYSERPQIPYSKDFYVTQIDEILDQLKIDKPVNIIGASQGGGIVVAYAARHSDRINSIGLMAPNGGGDPHVTNPVLLMPVIGDWVFRVVGPTVFRNMMSEANKNSPRHDALLEWMDEQSRYRGFGDGVLNSVRNTVTSKTLTWQPDALQAIGNSKRPVLAIWGTKDVVVPYVQSREFQKRIPQLQLVSLKDKGHAITFGRAETVIATIIPFLKSANGIEAK